MIQELGLTFSSENKEMFSYITCHTWSMYCCLYWWIKAVAEYFSFVFLFVFLFQCEYVTVIMMLFFYNYYVCWSGRVILKFCLFLFLKHKHTKTCTLPLLIGMEYIFIQFLIPLIKNWCLKVVKTWLSALILFPVIFIRAVINKSSISAPFFFFFFFKVLHIIIYAYFLLHDN